MARLERAHAEAPTDPETACNLAMLYLAQQQDARAEQILAPALAAHPEHPRVQLHMAMALAHTATERAREHAEKALQGADDPELRLQALGVRLMLQGHGLR
jgi:Tfp pilus assembly protein PilF